MNIGTRPTVKGTHQTIETFLLDFNGDLYDAKLKIHLLKRLRNEQKFDSLEQLKQQIRLDENTAKKYIASIAKD
jgi:riboflavin kinase/FMN adenylyltransferase